MRQTIAIPLTKEGKFYQETTYGTPQYYKDLISFYKENCDTLPPLSYEKTKQVLSDYIDLLFTETFYKGKKILLPYRLGSISFKKAKPTYDKHTRTLGRYLVKGFNPEKLKHLKTFRDSHHTNRYRVYLKWTRSLDSDLIHAFSYYGFKFPKKYRFIMRDYILENSEIIYKYNDTILR